MKAQVSKHANWKAAKHVDRHTNAMHGHHVATETESGVKVTFGPVLRAAHQASD